MALGTQSRPLLVPAADVLAKNMRAVESACTAPEPSTSQRTDAPSLFPPRRRPPSHPRFLRASSFSKSNPIALFLKRLIARRPTSSNERPPLRVFLDKMLPHLERASVMASRLPDPTLIFLALVMAVLLVQCLRPMWLNPLLIRLAVISAFLPVLALALLWRKTDLIVAIRTSENPFSHPVEHRLDGLEAELTAREQVLTAAEASLNESRKQLDDLRRELAKHPHAADAGTVLMPSRKAAEMIAAGALGAGYDPDAAHVVEAKRKEESVKKSREEWRAKAEETEGDVKQTKENLKRMADHAATAYNTRTKEIKTRSAGGSGRGPAVERLMSINLRKAIMTGHAESEPRRSSLATVQSVEGSVANSTGSRKRLALFRRRRRTTGATQDEDMSERDLSISLQP